MNRYVISKKKKEDTYDIDELVPIVAWLTEKYTSKESTSVSYSTARQLMGAVIYCIREFEVTEGLETTALNLGGRQMAKDAYEKGYVTTIMNRKRRIDELNNTNYMIRQQGERMALNTPIQGSSADILKKAMIDIYNEFNKKKLKSKMLLQVHDELIFNVLKDEEDEVKEIVDRCMDGAYKLDVPLKVDIETGDNWYDAK